jgi:Amt family ammonium transporter
MNNPNLIKNFLFLIILGSLLYFKGLEAVAWAFNEEETTKPIKALSEHAASMDMIWTLIASFLIFLMQAGFTLVEVGFTRAKNAGNVVMKNMVDFAIGAIGFFFVGYGLMFGSSWGGFLGGSDFFLSHLTQSWPNRQLEIC